MADISSIAQSNVQSNYEKYSEYFADTDETSLDVDDFLNLLVSEMSNQDPMEPMSNTDFIAQLAQFSALQSMQNMTYYSNASFAASMVGKTVAVAYYDETGTAQSDVGVVSSVALDGQEFHFIVNGKTVEMKNIMEILPEGTTVTTPDVTEESDDSL